MGRFLYRPIYVWSCVWITRGQLQWIGCIRSVAMGWLQWIVAVDKPMYWLVAMLVPWVDCYVIWLLWVSCLGWSSWVDCYRSVAVS